MSTSRDNLTQDEHTLHHCAAMLRKDLEAYHSGTLRDGMTWKDIFRELLVFCMFAIKFHLSQVALQTKSMTYYHQAAIGSGTPPRIHPLLLSLSEVYNNSHSRSISSISEDDPGILSSNLYTSPNDLPPLDIHFPGQNGKALLCNALGSPLTSAASCRECMASEPQDNSAEVGDVAMNSPSAASNLETMALEPQDNLAEVGNATTTMPRKRGRASGGVVRSESLIFIEMLHRAMKVLPKPLLQDRQQKGRL
jgi:hypothetical protein